MQTDRATMTDPAPPSPQGLVRRARQELATTGHISDETCLRLIQRFGALPAADRRALLRGLTRPRGAP